MVARTRQAAAKKATKPKKATKESARSPRPSAIVTAAEAAGRAIGRAVTTAVTTVEGIVGHADAKQKKPAKARTARKAVVRKRPR